MAPGLAQAAQTPEQHCERAATKLGLDPGAFDAIYTGTYGDDTSYEPGGVSDFSGGGAADLVCGFNGDDSLGHLDADDVFIGGNGDDSAESLSGTSVFYGGNGRDSVLGIFQSATFRGGNGADLVSFFDDHIDAFWAQYDGGRGPDRLMQYTILGGLPLRRVCALRRSLPVSLGPGHSTPEGAEGPSREGRAHRVSEGSHRVLGLTSTWSYSAMAWPGADVAPT